ncbi:MAG: DUF4332 domain-containing protein [Flavihumibacter sp.]
MAYPVIDIEGIGETYSAKLGELGIHTTGDLLEKAGTRAGRAAVAAATKIPETLILTWVNHADLFRLNGVAGQTAELLEAAGVDSVKELANRNAANLHAKMLEVNDQYGLSGKVPSEDTLQGMILAAKELDRKVFH